MEITGMKNYSFFIILILFTLLPAASKASSLRFEVDPSRSLVQFTSQAPFETFVGKSRDATGWVEGNERNLLLTRALFRVPVESLKTGNRLRDKDLRLKFMEADKFPEITFELGKVPQPRSLKPGTVTRVVVEGTFTIHGVSRREPIPLDLTYLDRDRTLLIRGRFSVRLSDYQIERPSFLFMRLAETVDVEIDLVLNLR